ncbi:hypothetical protein FPOAC1_008518 [Fusarium poae]|uniref:hypothetical protein n=1 Tax=Fusarium poae TaxID=36050 RepID=UPI001CEB98A4|nr:hypothetical protein FPOAC1_008518 [Fusarium poae]KAG8669130.1 hypothetical protein FPOAC1_008518 [Fusarium poae]
MSKNSIYEGIEPLKPTWLRLSDLHVAIPVVITAIGPDRTSFDFSGDLTALHNLYAVPFLIDIFRNRPSWLFWDQKPVVCGYTRGSPHLCRLYRNDGSWPSLNLPGIFTAKLCERLETFYSFLRPLPKNVQILFPRASYSLPTHSFHLKLMTIYQIKLFLLRYSADMTYQTA